MRAGAPWTAIGSVTRRFVRARASPPSGATQFARDAVTQRDRGFWFFFFFSSPKYGVWNQTPPRRDARGTPPLLTHHPILTSSDLFQRHLEPHAAHAAAALRFSTADSAARRGALRARPDSVNDQPPETPKCGWAFFRTPLTHFEQREKIIKRSAGASLYYEWARCSSCGSRDHARLLSPADFVFWRVEQQSNSMCVKRRER